MSDFNQPTTSSDYLTGVLPQLKARDVDAITLCLVDPTNIPTGAIKWNRASSKFQEYDGAAFQDKLLAVAGGGTGSGTAAGARTNLGLGSIATQDNNAVNITGGTIGTAVNIDATRLTSGFVDQARLGSGAFGVGSKFLADNQTWLTPSSVPTGTLAMWLTGVAPTGWILLQGGNVSRTTYADLFALWGTTHGVGDGSTTFGIPDCRQRFPIGRASSGTGSGALASTGGTIDFPVNMPATGWDAYVTLTDFSDRLTSHIVQPDSDANFNVVSVLNTTRLLANVNPPFIVVHFMVKT